MFSVDPGENVKKKMLLLDSQYVLGSEVGLGKSQHLKLGERNSLTLF